MGWEEHKPSWPFLGIAELRFGPTPKSYFKVLCFPAMAVEVSGNRERHVIVGLNLKPKAVGFGRPEVQFWSG